MIKMKGGLYIPPFLFFDICIDYVYIEHDLY